MGVLPATDGETGFTAELGRRHADLFEAFYQHPFLKGLREGSLSREQVLHYVAQDYQYLTAYTRCYGLGMALSPDRRWMRFFHDNAAVILCAETHAHESLCAYVGVSYEEAQADHLAPTAQAYINHMMEAGRDTLGVLLSALLPCPWTYLWAAARFTSETPLDPSHPFYGWWDFYAGRYESQKLTQTRAMLDELAAAAGPAERERMERAFVASCHYEIRFWEMAWSLEDWTPPNGS
ncbi:transcriptional regulator [Thermobifida fusca TM51]|uniref:Aminopyrimidine aminohydrolase n=1 Tax=Thermobifida fusca TM51 TaxID=1169414 RepID=A0A9P2T758_THEFU|nr:thiaminase II [Thermobifida fusca]EOR69897.1 transcriptional regulator [Thermobifida fusca TM51]